MLLGLPATRGGGDVRRRTGDYVRELERSAIEIESHTRVVCIGETGDRDRGRISVASGRVNVKLCT